MISEEYSSVQVQNIMSEIFHDTTTIFGRINTLAFLQRLFRSETARNLYIFLRAGDNVSDVILTRHPDPFHGQWTVHVSPTPSTSLLTCQFVQRTVVLCIFWPLLLRLSPQKKRKHQAGRGAHSPDVINKINKNTRQHKKWQKNSQIYHI